MAQQPVAVQQPVVMVPAPPKIDLNYSEAHPAMALTNPASKNILFYENMHDNMKCALGVCTFQCCCWDKARRRSYYQITENTVEYNYPIVCFPLCCMEECTIDYVQTKYLDRSRKFVRKSTCSPVHCCYCIECCGEVVGYTSFECCNNDIMGVLAFFCLCGCFGLCQSYTIGHRNAQHFADKYGDARQNFFMARPGLNPDGSNQLFSAAS